MFLGRIFTVSQPHKSIFLEDVEIGENLPKTKGADSAENMQTSVSMDRWLIDSAGQRWPMDDIPTPATKRLVQNSCLPCSRSLSNLRAPKDIFSTGRSFTVRCRSRDFWRSLLRLTSNSQNQRVQTQFRAKIRPEMPGAPLSSCLLQYFVHNLDNDVHVLMS